MTSKLRRRDYAREMKAAQPETPAEVWCAECDKPAVADFRDGEDTVSLCGKHAAKRWPSEWVQ